MTTWRSRGLRVWDESLTCLTLIPSKICGSPPLCCLYNFPNPNHSHRVTNFSTGGIAITWLCGSWSPPGKHGQWSHAVNFVFWWLLFKYSISEGYVCLFWFTHQFVNDLIWCHLITIQYCFHLLCNSFVWVLDKHICYFPVALRANQSSTCRLFSYFMAEYVTFGNECILLTLI